MLKNAFFDVYNKFKLHFYQEIFQRFQGREASLTTVETFCMEAIQALPASYDQRICRLYGNFYAKCCIQGGQSHPERLSAQDSVSGRTAGSDHLEVTQRYMDYYNVTFST